MSMKNSNDTSWDRTSDLPICSTALLPDMWWIFFVTTTYCKPGNCAYPLLLHASLLCRRCSRWVTATCAVFQLRLFMFVARRVRGWGSQRNFWSKYSSAGRMITQMILRFAWGENVSFTFSLFCIYHFPFTSVFLFPTSVSKLAD